MKDVVTCEKLRGVGNKLRSGDVRMRKLKNYLLNNINKKERTQGTETSQYLEENKVKTIPGVAASEMGKA